ncbi:chemotaxis protein CheX [Paenibacillus sp. J2TS4]|uniref:chemotaxis protein CheX n=1 Tax=Paenibacillus sp. J2TS4 TaxID=2807194 RepID=UPI001AFD1720|nr:chemotaxis protein CheX [Paenibacillus sp. J2TS4]GIP31238.1 CheY-P phosphatase CheX [Paenibacillus sp. J2TS4]
MKAEYINSFLESAASVLEQLIQVRPMIGQHGVKEMVMLDNYVWIQIGLTGQMDGDVMFGLHEGVALKLVSAMMGGFVLTELDDIGRSAISELGNMISGNASTLLFNQGLTVDITPPQIILPASTKIWTPKRALSVPLMMDGIGELDIQVVVA